MLTEIQHLDISNIEHCDPPQSSTEKIFQIQPLITNEILGNNSIYLNTMKEHLIKTIDERMCSNWSNINDIQNALLCEISNLRNSMELRLRVLEDNLADQNKLRYRLQELQCELLEYHNKYTFYYNELNERRIKDAKRHKQKIKELSDEYIKNVIELFKQEFETKNTVSLSQIGDAEFMGEILPDLQCYAEIAEERGVPLITVVPLHILSKLMH